MKFLAPLFIVVLLLGCKKKEDPKPPEIAKLVFPANNSECTTGSDLSATSSQVEFRWQMAPNADTYELRVTNMDANTTQTISTSALSAKLPLEKGGLYSWLVRTRNASVTETAVSETWRFYNAGFETTYAPFPAEIIAPKLGSSVVRDINNQVTLEWIGSDIDNDVEHYDVYLSTEKPPATLVESFTSATTSTKINVSADTVYYWKVITKDGEGNTSDSGVFDFRAQ